MAATYNLTSLQVPTPTAGSTSIDPGVEESAPVASNMLMGSRPSQAIPIMQELAARIDLASRYGGGIGVCNGLTLSADGLALTVAAGQALVDGLVTLAEAGDGTLADDTRNHVWLLQTGDVQVRQDLNAPSTLAAYLGSIPVADGVAGTEDYSGRVDVRGAVLWRRTADLGAPQDTPPEGMALWTVTLGGVYLWGGEAHYLAGGPLVADAGSPDSGAILLRSAPTPGATVTVTVGGVATVYEFTDVSPSGSHVAVSPGASAVAAAANLQDAIDTEQGGVLASAVHATDTAYIDLRTARPGVVLALSESTSGVEIAVQDNGSQEAQAARRAFRGQHTVTAFEVTRGRVVVATGLTAIDRLNYLVDGSPWNRWDGSTSVTGGTVEFVNDGSRDLAAGDVITVDALGR
jgi:hypothetical protein